MALDSEVRVDLEVRRGRRRWAVRAPDREGSARYGSQIDREVAGGRPQTNGKIERFHRTMSAEWAFACHYKSEDARRRALPGWLHQYNHHRPYSAIGKAAPITRLINVPGQYI